MSTQINQREYVRTDAASQILGVSVSTLAKLRMRGEGPEFIKLGRRLVLYRTSDIFSWLESSRKTSTSDI